MKTTMQGGEKMMCSLNQETNIYASYNGHCTTNRAGAAYPGRKKEKMTAYEKSLNITEFFTVDSTRRHVSFVTYHSTANDAIKAAESDWNHLTKAEQKTATVSAWRVIQDNIRSDLVESDSPWWEATTDRQNLLVKFPDDK